MTFKCPAPTETPIKKPVQFRDGDKKDQGQKQRDRGLGSF